MRQYRNVIENNCNVCKQKAKKGWEEGGGGIIRDIIACVVGKIGSSVSIVNLRKSTSLYQ